ncbi:MAG: hypothetical protein U0931_20835 [Vulcanimicrobiota bacterium]
MKKLLTVAALVVGLGLAASAENCQGGAKCCAQQGLRAGWFTGAGTLTHEGHDYKADGSCCSVAKADAKCSCGNSKSGCACGGKSEAKSDGKAGGCCGKCGSKGDQK